MKNLTRVAAVLAVLGVAAPALPCGLMHQSADASTPAPTVADQKAQKAGDKVQAKSTVKKAPAAQKKATVATK